MIVTRHAKRRLKERLGLKHRAALRHAQTAFDQGTFAIEHPERPIRAFYQGVQSEDLNQAFIIYNDTVYIFGYNFYRECPSLITVYPLPEEIDRMR